MPFWVAVPTRLRLKHVRSIVSIRYSERAMIVEVRLTVYSYSCRGQELLMGTMLMLAAVATVF